MKYGMNLLLWGAEITDGHLPILEKLKSFGFDGVEVPMFNLDLDYEAWGKRLDDLGLERTAVTVRNKDDNPISSDAAVRAKGVEMNKKTLDCCAALGAQTLCGPYHSAIGHFSGAGPTADEWKWGVESMRATAEHAGKVDVMLAVEALNRFEIYFLNAQEDTARFVREVNHPSCKQMYDTFHANIEEKDPRKTLNAIKDTLIHFHVSENDRSTPGKGDIQWDKNFQGLADINYDGWLMIEAFGLALPELAAATMIWRKMFDNELDLAKDGLAFMKSQVAKYLS